MSLIMHESHLFFHEYSIAQVLGLQFIKRMNVKTEHCYDINLHEYGKKWIIIFFFMRWKELSQQIWILVYIGMWELEEPQRISLTPSNYRKAIGNQHFQGTHSPLCGELMAKMVQTSRLPKSGSFHWSTKGENFPLIPIFLNIQESFFYVSAFLNALNKSSSMTYKYPVNPFLSTYGLVHFLVFIYSLFIFKLCEFYC